MDQISYKVSNPGPWNLQSGSLQLSYICIAQAIQRASTSDRHVLINYIIYIKKKLFQHLYRQILQSAPIVFVYITFLVILYKNTHTCENISERKNIQDSGTLILSFAKQNPSRLFYFQQCIKTYSKGEILEVLKEHCLNPDVCINIE